MKMSTKFYRMRRKNKKGLLFLGVLFLFIIVIAISGTRFILRPTPIYSNRNTTSAEIKASSNISKYKNEKFISTKEKIISNNSKSSTKPSIENKVDSMVEASSSVSSSESNQIENQEDTSAYVPTTTATVYSASYEGFVGSSVVSYEEALYQAKNAYEAAILQEQQTADSVSKLYAQKGYDTNIIQEGGD